MTASVLNAYPPPSAPAPLPLNTESITRLILDFYDGVLADPLLGPVFAKEVGARWDEHLDRMVAFWSTVMLGSQQFRGNLVRRHMQLPNVTPAHFTAWMQLWHQHTEQRFDSTTTYKLRRVAHDIGRQLFVSYFEVSTRKEKSAALGAACGAPHPAH